MDIIQIILLAVLTFIIAIDQFSLTEIISRPIINCTSVSYTHLDVYKRQWLPCWLSRWITWRKR